MDPELLINPPESDEAPRVVTSQASALFHGHSLTHQHPLAGASYTLATATPPIQPASSVYRPSPVSPVLRQQILLVNLLPHLRSTRIPFLPIMRSPLPPGLSMLSQHPTS
ncbi:hypothetical protein NQZ68_026415 [Dissostichus eleginoides]|nr:hypothetical protein NQZ68_026415 [Dissostichus eleginoides]